MKLKTLSMLFVVALLGCGAVEEATVAEEVGASEAALTASSACCTRTATSPWTEAQCDSVGYSAGRCNQVNGGGTCTWLRECGSCCVPQTDLAYTSECASYAALGQDRCNAVWGGTRCMWACL